MNIEKEIQARLWKLLVGFAILYSLDSISTAVVSVLIGVKWDQLDTTEFIIRIALVVKAWASCMLALVTMVVKKAKDHELPLPDGSKISQTSVTETTIPPKP